MRTITDYERDCGRRYRVIRKAAARGVRLPTVRFPYRLPIACLFAAIGHACAMESAAHCRRHGGPQGKMCARRALDNAKAERLKWSAAGGLLP